MCRGIPQPVAMSAGRYRQLMVDRPSSGRLCQLMALQSAGGVVHPIWHAARVGGSQIPMQSALTTPESLVYGKRAMTGRRSCTANLPSIAPHDEKGDGG
jgi:hypothetical protein